MAAAAGNKAISPSRPVSVTLAAASTPFGCFVLDGSGTAVATVIFTRAATAGQTVTLAGNADLGTIRRRTSTAC